MRVIEPCYSTLRRLALRLCAPRLAPRAPPLPQHARTPSHSALTTQHAARRAALHHRRRSPLACTALIRTSRARRPTNHAAAQGGAPTAGARHLHAHHPRRRCCVRSQCCAHPAAASSRLHAWLCSCASATCMRATRAAHAAHRHAAFPVQRAAPPRASSQAGAPVRFIHPRARACGAPSRLSSRNASDCARVQRQPRSTHAASTLSDALSRREQQRAARRRGAARQSASARTEGHARVCEPPVSQHKSAHKRSTLQHAPGR